MEQYVSQLIEDLQAAKSKKVFIKDKDEKATMEEYFEIKQTAFPPADRLSESQINAINDAILSLLDSHHYIVNITMIKDLPAKNLYQYFVKQWVEKIYYVTAGLLGLEFCDNNPEICGLYEWCKGTWCEVEVDDDDYIPPFFDGIYNLGGNDVLAVPIPELCLTCRSYLVDDWEENLLCAMTRADSDSRKEDENFICYAYKKARNM